MDAIFYLLFIIIIVIQGLFNPIPLGNENSTVRRLPFITFGIITLNVLIFLLTLSTVSQQDRKVAEKRDEIVAYLEKNPTLLFDDKVRKEIVDNGVVSQRDLAMFDNEVRKARGMKEVYADLMGEQTTAYVYAEYQEKLKEFLQAKSENIYYAYGLAPNGQWKYYQLITCLFLHGGWMHLIGNMIFFFAVGFSLEDLWGRGLFLFFYLGAGIAACLPSIVHPEAVPMIGASGAISGAMGAFLVRLPRAKIKVGWAFIPMSIFGLMRLAFMRRKPFGIVHIPAFIFLSYYFVSQLLSWWFYKKSGMASGVAFTAHIAGFAFGVIFALLLKASKIEEKYISPKIEGKISFGASPALNQAFEHLDKGEVVMAEHKIQSHLRQNPNDVEATMLLVQVYQKNENYDGINQMCGRLIRYHLSQGDKEAALYAYDGLLSAFPEDAVHPKLAVRDWMMICEYLREIGLIEAASFEYERLAKACPDDPLAVRACVQGGETAMSINDYVRAMRLFETAWNLNPSDAYRSRIQVSIEKCGQHLNNLPKWAKSERQQPLSPVTKLP